MKVWHPHTAGFYEPETVFDTSKVNILYTSDTHFYHAKIIDFCDRPFEDVDDMNEQLISRWNSIIDDDDIVFHLGDFAFGGVTKWCSILSLLKGRKYLIKGNHEYKNLPFEASNYFEYVSDQLQITVDEQTIILSHCPFLCWGGSHRDVWNLHGHVHTRPNAPITAKSDYERMLHKLPTQYDVGVDNNDYYPVSHSQVKSIIQQQQEDYARKRNI